MLSETHAKIVLAAHTVRKQLPEGWSPQVGVILGSGLGALADEVEAVASIPYSIYRVCSVFGDWARREAGAGHIGRDAGGGHAGPPPLL